MNKAKVEHTSASAPFTAYSRYYDLLYQDKDYPAEAAYIHDVLQRHGVKHGDLLEFGSGTGKHGRLLSLLGYRVHGIERSREMVSQALQTEGFTCEAGDICSVRLARTFDAVLSLFHVVSYQVTNAAATAVFARAAEHLEAGGLFVFDIWYSPAVYHSRPEVRVKRMANASVEVLRIAEPIVYPNEDRVDVAYNVFVTDLVTKSVETVTEVHGMRHFSLPELDLLGAMNGFERIGAEAFLTGAAPSEETWGVCVVMRKI
ncbi:class I SAM-dependent DNA methyltransferase [Methylotetracoccus oryzae]|uniref:class I SAM-dependent DNA methyltransferase n=1 Tax=Methylotetracoccus oryzae TaxID=1919059 RepID=UPI0013A538B3|nr:methyltransferase domain-containing protein [Methylotetracoccus oryzae]